MFWTKIKRVVRAGFVSFWRNSFVSLASVSVMTVTLCVIGVMLFVGVVLNASLVELRNKVDINVYFVTSAQVEDVLAMQKSLEALPEVQSVEYVSREDALAAFRARHESDQLTLQALDELGENPLGAVLNVKAKEPGQYAGIAKFLEDQNAVSQNSTPIIDQVNYYKNKDSIDKLSRIIASATKLGTVVAVIFGLISILITFNTVRLAIFTSREEISVMRLVGASASYIRGPFVVIGIMYGVMAALATLIIFYPLSLWLGPTTEGFFSGINIASYYIHNFGTVFLIIMGTGIVLGAVSSYLAVRRHLTV